MFPTKCLLHHSASLCQITFVPIHFFTILLCTSHPSTSPSVDLVEMKFDCLSSILQYIIWLLNISYFVRYYTVKLSPLLSSRSPSLSSPLLSPFFLLSLFSYLFFFLSSYTQISHSSWGQRNVCTFPAWNSLFLFQWKGRSSKILGCRQVCVIQ